MNRGELVGGRFSRRDSRELEAEPGLAPQLAGDPVSVAAIPESLRRSKLYRAFWRIIMFQSPRFQRA